uniref:Uncharacterized protein n=1 Tax=uncultured Armatimonadetes bacterium TaxID=157466 RepID=A0A6J4I5L9_9BACT|nr:hypothetical protein AVDCRST_MAG63-1421 [uncultured Armatimonadetes bacterium]
MKQHAWTPDELTEPASGHWDVVRDTNGPVYNPHYLLIVRHRSGSPSRLVLTTSDWEKALEAERAVSRSLARLDNEGFLRLMGLDAPVARTGR